MAIIKIDTDKVKEYKYHDEFGNDVIMLEELSLCIVEDNE